MYKYSKSTGGFYHTESSVDIPEDAVEVSSERHAELMQGQSEGKMITAGVDGIPFLTDRPAPTVNEVIYAQIVELERSVTPRRLREATLGTDNGWLANLDAQITELRKQLTNA